MNRSMSRIEGGRIIEYAAYRGGPLADDEVRERARNAPAHIKASIDRARESRGMRPLWAKPTRAVSRPVRPRRRPPVKAWALVGAAAPGMSRAKVCAYDALELPERFEPRAFDRTLRALADREAFVDLLDGHGGPLLASTADGTLRLWVDPTVGLMVSATVPNTRERRRIVYQTASGEVGLSIGFKPYRMSIERGADGKRCRVVHEATIDHIALIRPETGVPAYASRVRVAPAERDHRIVTTKAMLDALRVICSQDGLA